MTKKPKNTKTIIIVATSVVVAVGVGFLINKLVKDNKKKKEEAKQKQADLDALKVFNDTMKAGADIYEKGATGNVSNPSSNPTKSEPSTFLKNKMNQGNPSTSFGAPKQNQTFNVYKPIMK